MHKPLAPVAFLVVLCSCAGPLAADPAAVRGQLDAKRQELSALEDQLARHRTALEDLTQRAQRRYQDLLAHRQDFLERRRATLSDRSSEYEALRLSMADLTRQMAATTYADERARLFLRFTDAHKERAQLKDSALAELAREDQAARSDEEALARDIAELVKQIEAERLAWTQVARDDQAAQTELKALEAELARQVQAQVQAAAAPASQPAP